MSVLGTDSILAQLGVEPPYLLLDRIELDVDRAYGVKLLSVSEAFFAGHFPEQPIMPGVLQLEAMVQLATVAWRQDSAVSDCVMMQSVRKVKFRRPVVPGDLLHLEVTLSDATSTGLTVVASARVGEEVTCEAQFTLATLADPAVDLAPRQLIAARAAEVPVLQEGALDTEEIQSFIPHRYPFLLIDRVEGWHQPEEDGMPEMVAVKNLTATEPNLVRHPSGRCWLSNCFQLEVAAQAGCAYALSRPEHHGKLAYFMSIEDCTFNRPLIPGDRMYVVMSLRTIRQRFGQAFGKVYVGEDLVSVTNVKFALTE